MPWLETNTFPEEVFFFKDDEGSKPPNKLCELPRDHVEGISKFV